MQTRQSARVPPAWSQPQRLAEKLRRIDGLSPAAVAWHAGTPDRPAGIAADKAQRKAQRLTFTVRPTQPYDFDWVFGFLAARVLEPLEEVGASFYRRRLPSGEWVSVSKAGTGSLKIDVPLDAEPAHSLVARIVRIFDLDAPIAEVMAHLGGDPILGPGVTAAPGLRVPGAWDGFEACVRAVLGQQVSVARATVLANAMIDRYGDGAFPQPRQLIHAEIAELGMPGRRGRAISTIAEQVMAEKLTFAPEQDLAAFSEQLCAIDGIGPWTASYARLRVLKDSDAFPESDWVVLKALDATPAQARRTAEPWQPFRAYAVMYLWHSVNQARAQQKAAR